MREALALYGRALSDARASSGPAGPLLRFDDGAPVPFPVARYVGPADPVERELLASIAGPVLDVGCGPGRHLHALAAHGVYALGVDLSPAAVALARRRGARAVVADIFDELPGARTWRTALLLDGNIGIGGDPVRLLSRLRLLLADDGVVLLELEPPGCETYAARARLELGAQTSDWFAWARVSVSEIEAVATVATMVVEREWSCGKRWFARLRPVDWA